jgi:hypothetical protein
MGIRVKHVGVAGIDARSKDATSAGCMIGLQQRDVDANESNIL